MLPTEIQENNYWLQLCMSVNYTHIKYQLHFYIYTLKAPLGDQQKKNQIQTRTNDFFPICVVV